MDPRIWPSKSRTTSSTYIQQLCEDTGCSPEDQPKAMNDREEWRERVRDIRASGMTWWWLWHILYKSSSLSSSSSFADSMKFPGSFWLSVPTIYHSCQGLLDCLIVRLCLECLVRLTWMVLRWEVSGRTPAVNKVWRKDMWKMKAVLVHLIYQSGEISLGCLHK